MNAYNRTNAFDRLRHLLTNLVPPDGLVPIYLHLGEQRLSIPIDILGARIDSMSWTRYPTLGGTADLRTAYSVWLNRRFGIGSIVEGEKIAIEPTPGSKQAIATAIHLAVRRKRIAGHMRPAVLIPSPFYPTYPAAVEWAEALPIFYSPDAGDLERAIEQAARVVGIRIAAIILCNPTNPSGRIYNTAELSALTAIAKRLDATLIVDECYTDLVFDSRPTSALSVLAYNTSVRVVAIHSLSKRSGAPGLRSGFIAGDPASIADYAAFNRGCGVSLPNAICALSEALWLDEFHVEQLRGALRGVWSLADEILGMLPNYRRPEAGFFLWIPVSDDETAARLLYTEAGLMTMPGRYLSETETPASNRQKIAHLRLALAQDGDLVAEALKRFRLVAARHNLTG